MNTSILFIIVAIAVLVVIALFSIFVWKNNKGKVLTPLAGLAFGCIIAGLIFNETRFVGYGLLGVGVILAVVDMVMKVKKP